MSSATDRIKVCKACGVPLLVSWELGWDNNGVIFSKSSPNSRWTFFESEVFDPIFQNVEELIGVSINNIVMESRRNEARKYIAKLFPPETREIFSSWGKRPDITAAEREALFQQARETTVAIYDVARTYGYAASDLGELWQEKADYPWRSNLSRKPYSVSLYLAESLGSCEAFEDRDMWVDYTLVDGVYHVTYYPSEHPLELKGRSGRTSYAFKSGEIEYERCPECGVPREISRYLWDLEQGSITDPDTGRRMAIIGSRALDAIVLALVDELGEEIAKMLIEAQRGFTKNYWNTENWRRRGTDFQRLFCLRGLGNVVKFDGDREHLTIRIQNSCLHLLLLGVIQALVELVYAVEESTCSWELFPDGDLEVTIRV